MNQNKKSGCYCKPYINFENYCSNPGFSLTSNAKYLPLNNEVYDDKWTASYRYPGLMTNNTPWLDPKVLKAWTIIVPVYRKNAYSGRRISLFPHESPVREK